MTTPPTHKQINDVLRDLEQPKWQSDAEKLGLPTVNVRDSGAPRLDVDGALRRTEPDYTKERR